MKRILCIALSLPTAFPAHAESVFGYQIGKPLDLPECSVQLATPQGDKIYFASQQTTCLEAQPNHGETWRTVLHFSEKDAPAFVKDRRASPVLSHGVLIGLDFSTYGIQYQSTVFAELTEKYGKPIKLVKSKLQNGFGAKFESIHAQWLQKTGLKVTFDGADVALDEGSVSIDTPASAAARTGWEQASHKVKTL